MWVVTVGKQHDTLESQLLLPMTNHTRHQHELVSSKPITLFH